MEVIRWQNMPFLAQQSGIENLIWSIKMYFDFINGRIDEVRSMFFTCLVICWMFTNKSTYLKMMEEQEIMCKKSFLETHQKFFCFKLIRISPYIYNSFCHVFLSSSYFSIHKSLAEIWIYQNYFIKTFSLSVFPQALSESLLLMYVIINYYIFQWQFNKGNSLF